MKEWDGGRQERGMAERQREGLRRAAGRDGSETEAGRREGWMQDRGEQERGMEDEEKDIGMIDFREGRSYVLYLCKYMCSNPPYFPTH